MSTIDQAFIRAFGERPSATAPPRPAPHPFEPASSIAESVAQPPESEAIEQPAARFTTIHVGLGSVVPPPHAPFFRQRETTSASSATKPAKTIESPADQKLPLSSFSSAGPQPAPLAPWKPGLEVDLVKWPTICQELLSRYAERFDGLTDAICRRASREKLVIAITGLVRGEGRTILTLCLARRLAAASVELALVDADFEKPGLAGNLGLAIDRGWECIFDGDGSVGDLVIESIVDRFAILPLQASVSPAKAVSTDYRLAATLNELVEHFQVVLIDAGPLTADENQQHWMLNSAVRIDAVVLAQDMRRNSSQLAAASARLAAVNRSPWGIAELFLNERSAA